MKITAIAGLLLFIALEASAQSLLPDSFSGWKTNIYRPVSTDQLPEFAGNDAPIVREYGFLSGEYKKYVNADSTLTVRLWQMKDVSGSFGLYTFYRDIGTASLEQGDRIAIWPDRLLIQRGVYLLDARGASLKMGEGRLLLAGIIPAPESENLLPSLPLYLPQENLIPQSSKFLMGPVAFERLEKLIPASTVEFDTGAEAQFAEYQMDGNKLRLLLVSYPTPQLAAKKLRSFQELPAISQPASNVFLKRKGPLLCFVLDSPSPATSEALANKIRYASEVTWSEYVPTRRDHVGDLITNVFLLAGFVLLFAFVAGLSFGGIRILAKRFVPIPIFDRPSQVEIIRLDLSND